MSSSLHEPVWPRSDANATRIVESPVASAAPVPLVDRFRRVHHSLRISVTDVCNIRCQYCMPEETVSFLPSHRHLTYPQIAHFVGVTAALGITKYRLTGGEPLIRPNLDHLIYMLRKIPGVEEVALTTNGMLLARQLPALLEAGLSRVNISLDTLSDEVFKRLSRRRGLHQVLEGIDAAIAEPRLEVRLNAVVLRDLNLADVVELVRFSRQRGVVIRFIEFMPLDAEKSWNSNRMVSGSELRQLLSNHFGPLEICTGSNPSQPSSDYEFADGSRVGFIDSVSQPFCDRCDRLRLTSDGKIRNCLFGKREWDVSPILAQWVESASIQSPRQKETDFSAQVEKILRECVLSKAAAHGIGEPDFQPPQRAMYQIGG